GVFPALILLMIAPVALTTSDSLEVLAAVLNTNFWLATHVVCVTAGYALCVISAALAHIILLRPLFEVPGTFAALLQRYLYLSVLISLLFMALGTALGGIWADQSWGRFWGWDPKENGALLI